MHVGISVLVSLEVITLSAQFASKLEEKEWSSQSVLGLLLLEGKYNGFFVGFIAGFQI